MCIFHVKTSDALSAAIFLLIFELIRGEFITVTYQMQSLRHLLNVHCTCFQEVVQPNRCVEYMSNYILITKLQQSVDGFWDVAWPLSWNKMQTQFVLDSGNRWLLKDAGVNNHAVIRRRWLLSYFGDVHKPANETFSVDCHKDPQFNGSWCAVLPLDSLLSKTLILISFVTLIKTIRYREMNLTAII